MKLLMFILIAALPSWGMADTLIPVGSYTTSNPNVIQISVLPGMDDTRIVDFTIEKSGSTYVAGSNKIFGAISISSRGPVLLFVTVDPGTGMAIDHKKGYPTFWSKDLSPVCDAKKCFFPGLGSQFVANGEMEQDVSEALAALGNFNAITFDNFKIEFIKE